jgi:hypothetical protein
LGVKSIKQERLDRLDMSTDDSGNTVEYFDPNPDTDSNDKAISNSNGD